jgi:hypothetical protein
MGGADMTSKILRLKQLGVAETTARRRIRAGIWPPGRFIDGQLAWFQDEIEIWERRAEIAFERLLMSGSLSRGRASWKQIGQVAQAMRKKAGNET